MPEYKMFSIYLNERLKEKGITIPALAKELGYVTLIHVPRWFDGRGLPMARELAQLAKVLDADPVVLGVGWLISQAPELEEVMQREVLAGREQKLPGAA
jgi:hypothetical protein